MGRYRYIWFARLTERTAKPTAENLRCSGRGKLSEVTSGRWSGWRLAAIVEAFTARNSNFQPVPETKETSQSAGISGMCCYVE